MAQKIKRRPAGARVMVKGAKPLLLLAVTNPLAPVNADSRQRPATMPSASGRAIYARRPVSRPSAP